MTLPLREVLESVEVTDRERVRPRRMEEEGGGGGGPGLPLGEGARADWREAESVEEAPGLDLNPPPIPPCF